MSVYSRNFSTVYLYPRTCVCLLNAYFVLFIMYNSIGIYLNKHYFRCVQLLSVFCNVFCNDNAGKNAKSATVQIQDSTLFREIQTSTMTFSLSHI